MPEKALKTKTVKKSPETRAVVNSSERNPHKLALKGQKDRELYLQWASIPAMLRMMQPADLERMGYDTSDPVFMKLLSIKKKGDFCREFGVGINQPSAWESRPDFYEEVNALANKSHVMKFRKDVDFAFTQKLIRHGDAPRMKLWKQLNEGWSERTESVNVNLNMTPADIVREIEERNRKLRPE